MKPIVHGLPLSPFVAKVLVVLDEKGIEHESRPLVPTPKTPELLRMNPLGKIPILEHGDLLLPDSSVICAYFERLHPDPALYPKDAREHARALWYEEYSDTALVEAITPIVGERLVKVQFFNGQPDEARVQDAIENKVPPVFDYLERQLGGAETLLSQLSIADVAIGCQLLTVSAAGFEPDPARWPRLARYATALWRRSSFQRVVALHEQGAAR